MNHREFWNRRAISYDQSVQKNYAGAYQRTIDLAKKYLTKEDVLLDFGCGTGIVTNEMAGSVEQIVAVDISDQMVVQAKAKEVATQIDNIIYLVGDLNQERIKATQFSVISAMNVLYFIRDLKGLLNQFYRMLPPGGFFLSATDCLGEKKNLRNILTQWFSFFGLFPYLRSFNMAVLTAAIEKAGFEVLETEILFPDPPNLFVVARKPKKESVETS